MNDLGPQLSWLDSHNGCTFNPDPARSPVGDCGSPPTLHVRLNDDAGIVAACAQHQQFALAHLPALDWHAWQAWCNMPGAIWHPSPTPDESDSWCSLDDSADASLRAREAERGVPLP
jgi:hypothetical protein